MWEAIYTDCEFGTIEIFLPQCYNVNPQPIWDKVFGFQQNWLQLNSIDLAELGRSQETVEKEEIKHTLCIAYIANIYSQQVAGGWM